MKKLILVALTAVSAVSFADSTKRILEQYRKEALMEQSKTVKEVKVKPEKPKKITFEPVDEVVEEVTVEEVVDDGRTHTTEDVIDKVNFYLQNNPEKNAKLQRQYRAVVGQE
ncbi:hypothetical protein [Leptotrichia trevisanii]|uniref:hypothetical protein n=1 Tax=Leptotrichia trevisanii TaxID=109328 RepID=UPI0026F14B7B|nr:hypothetical protein [Leptotrichia trevisanii]